MTGGVERRTVRAAGTPAPPMTGELMATRWTRGRSIAGLLATLILGCSNADDGVGDGPIAPARFVDVVVDSACADLADCCARDGFSFSERACRNQAGMLMDDRFARGTLAYDGDAAGRCARALRGRPAQCGGAEEDLTACEGVFHGNVPIGGPCVEGLDCAGFPEEAVCPFGSLDDQVCTAGSQRPTRAGAGDPCTGTCRREDDQSVCTLIGTAPSSFCFTDDGLYCASATHRCEPLIPEGGVCERQPDFPGCVTGTFCEHERCVPVRGAGDSCLVDICVPPLFCPSRGELACGPGLTCAFGDDPRCTPPQPDGSACTSFLECASRYCEISCDAESCARVGICGPFKTTTREQCAGLLATGDGTSGTARLPGGL